MKKVACTSCFQTEGLKLTAFKYGLQNSIECENCGSSQGKMLSKGDLHEIAEEYFVEGSYYYSEYGGASVVQFNEHQETDVRFSSHLKIDSQIFERHLGVGFFYYGPRMSYFGEIEPLQNLKNPITSQTVLDEIISKFPSKILSKEDTFYRLRTNPKDPNLFCEYDSPPIKSPKRGRLDSIDLNVLYGSFDIEICLHECRSSILDEMYIAKLRPKNSLNLLDLTANIEEEGTEFESLSLTIFYLFRAEKHSHKICRKIAKKAYSHGFDGIVFPSYFSKVKTNNYSNIAIFGSPIEKGLITVESIDRIRLNTVDYGFSFGPVI